MSIEKAYFHMFNRLSNLCDLMENLQENEKPNILALIKQIQLDTEKLYIEN